MVININELAAKALKTTAEFVRLYDLKGVVAEIFRTTVREAGYEDAVLPKGQHGDAPQSLAKVLNDLDELDDELKQQVGMKVRDKMVSVALRSQLRRVLADPTDLNHDGWWALKSSLQAKRGSGAFLWRANWEAAKMHPNFGELADALAEIVLHSTDAEVKTVAYEGAVRDYHELWSEVMVVSHPFTGEAVEEAIWIAVDDLTQRTDVDPDHLEEVGLWLEHHPDHV